MSYRIYLEYPRYGSRDEFVGCGYRQLHPYTFHTLGLALALRSKYYDEDVATGEVNVVVLDERGREHFSLPGAPVTYEIPF